MKLQTITTVAVSTFSSIHGVFASPLPGTLAVRSDSLSAADLSSSMAVFQGLITDALTTTVPANVSVSKRQESTGGLDSVNAIFDTIYGVVDGSIAVSEAPVQRRMVNPIRNLVDLLCALIDGGCPAGFNVKRDTSDDVQFVLNALNAWADGTVDFSGTVVSDFTLDDAVELANLLKDIVVGWRTSVNSGSASSTNISARDVTPGVKASVHQVAGHLERRMWDKQKLKWALKALAFAIDAYADTL